MAAPPVTLPLPFAPRTRARGGALAAWDVAHVDNRCLCLDCCGLAKICYLNLAGHNNSVELVVPMAFPVPDDNGGGGRLVDLRLRDGSTSALALEMDLLGVTPVESICVGLNLVLVHLLRHVIKRTNSDVGRGVVLTHDGLEVSHREETFFDGATPIYGEAVIRQCCKIPPHCKDNAVDEELDLGKVGRALGKAGDGILVVGGEAVYLRDHPDSRGG